MRLRSRLRQQASWKRRTNCHLFTSGSLQIEGFKFSKVRSVYSLSFVNVKWLFPVWSSIRVTRPLVRLQCVRQHANRLAIVSLEHIVFTFFLLNELLSKQAAWIANFWSSSRCLRENAPQDVEKYLPLSFALLWHTSRVTRLQWKLTDY